ncbi:MAG: MCE family protein [Pseudonocardia sp.]|nr:MCE family protein [Pseudonocardia sp.]
MGSWSNDRRQLQIVALVAVVVILLASGIWLVTKSGGRTVTAYFTNTSALFEGNDVRVLGVPVGKVDTISPEGTQVRVDMTITDPDVAFPQEVKAAIISPSLVTGRYVQLFPVAAAGAPTLADGATIPLERTAVPLGVDDLSRTATELSRALGPQGANSTGAVSDALDVAARNLDGNGQALNDTITNLGGLSGTLSGSSDDLFGTVTELQRFTETIAQDDAQVREFNGRVADVTGFLAGERENLGGALADLGVALGDVSAFVRDNRETLRSNVDRLSDVTQVLVDQRRALAEIVDVAPVGVGNLANSYNGSSGTLDTRANINELSYPPILTLCQQLKRATPEQLAPLGSVAETCSGLSPVLDGAVPLPSAAQVLSSLTQGQAPPVPGLALPTVPAPGTAPAPDTAPPATTVVPAPTTTPAPAGGDGGGFFSRLFGGGS